MERPEEPSKEDCCGSGCDPCIFDVYRRQLRLYEKYKTGSIKQDDRHYKSNIISETRYTPFKIVYIKKLCEDHSIIAFRYISSDGASDEEIQLYWEPGQHFLMKYCNNNSTSSKAYTPLWLSALCADGDKYHFMIILKKYTDSLVSKFLHSRLVGDVVLWRGPYGLFRHIPGAHGAHGRLCMMAQGTGIAPCYSIIQHILDNEDDFTTISLLCSFRDMDTILLRNQLYAFRQYWNFNYKIFLSRNESEDIALLYKEPVTFHKINACHIRDAFWPVSRADKFLICGSPTYMNCIKDMLIEEGLAGECIFTF